MSNERCTHCSALLEFCECPASAIRAANVRSRAEAKSELAAYVAELETLTAERDRLADALRRIRDQWERDHGECPDNNCDCIGAIARAAAPHGGSDE